MRGMSEIELKLLLDAASAKSIWKMARSLGLAEKVPAARMLRSVYWDTPDAALRRAGMVLRMRRDGRKWIQTLKCDGSLSGGLSVTKELEVAARAGRLDIEAIADEEVRDRVRELIGQAELAPVCETAIRRVSGLVRLADGTAAELAVDIGRIIAGERSAELQEAEIELVEGNPARLFEIARLLIPTGGLRFSSLAKSARAFLLAEEGFIEPPIHPRGAQAASVEKGQTVEQAAGAVLRECLDQVAVNVLAARDLDDPEAVHQLRVGLRRLRSALRVFSGPLAGPAIAALGAEARWLAAEAGRVRDLDVVAIEIVRPEAIAHPDMQALADLADRVATQATDARAHLRDLLSQARVQDLLLDLACFTATRGWLDAGDMGQTSRLAAAVETYAAHSLGKRWKKVRKAGRGFDELSDEARHQLRKELKKLRYAVEFFAPLFAEKKVRSFVGDLKRMQDTFGSINDAAMLRQMFVATEGAPQEQRAIGWITGASHVRAELAWTDAKSRWDALREAKRFWE